MDIGISVLIPVYNGALYLRKTLESLVNQSFKNFEVVLIDDGSSDSSLEILLEYQKKYDFIKVYKKPNEGTAAKAVNYGLNFASGEYFMYSSQDDLFSEKLLEVNYNIAKQQNADAVVPNTIFYFEGSNLKEGIYGLNGLHDIVLNGREAFSYSLNWEISGFVLWRRNLLENFDNKFFDFSINSDEYTTRLLYYYSKRVVFTEEIFYYRQNNPNAITKKWNSKLLESFITIEKLEKFVEENLQNNQDDLKKIYESLYFELTRISLIFFKSKKNLTRDESIDIDKYLKDIYYKNRVKFAQLKFKSPKQNFKKNLFLISYNSIKLIYLLRAIKKI